MLRRPSVNIRVGAPKVACVHRGLPCRLLTVQTAVVLACDLPPVLRGRVPSQQRINPVSLLVHALPGAPSPSSRHSALLAVQAGTCRVYIEHKSFEVSPRGESGLLLLYLTRFWVELAVELCPLLFVVVFGLGGRLLGALEGRPPTVDEELTNFEEETLGLCAMPTPLLMLEAPPMTL